ncbi:MAG: peptidylprolyl isomerase [Oscillospiraceae bacterium]|nr:peptidylprolyl isomerase [Oscillospiraceae bacterium]
MSASNKKKLRREQEAAKMTEKQLAAQQEAKKTKLMTAAFVVVMAAILVVAAVVGVSQTISSHGIMEKNTTAVTVGSHKISNAQLNYFYMDAINKFYSQYGSYASLFGLDTTKALDEQIVDEATGKTWADDFLDSAKENAKSIYAMADAAKAAGYTLPEAEADAIASELETLDLYGAMYGYGDGEQYLKAIYGTAASIKGYQEYRELSALASSYYNHYTETLTYEDADLRAKEAENFGAFSSYSFNSYYMSTSKFLTGGTTDADGNTTYSEEETAASEAAVKAAAESLLSAAPKSVEEFDAAIAALSVNEGTTAASTAYTDTLYTNANTLYADWLASADRKAGDMAIFPSESTATNTDGTETTTLSGYYVVFFNGSTDNSFALKNVRHILITPEHSHEEGETHEDGETYSEEELSAAKATAEEILKGWQSGEATEEAFAQLANEKSADGDGTTGGLYENVYPGQMVDSFEQWCYDASRKAGDTGIVESTYGYHIMYFVGDSDVTYRDYQIENALRDADVQTWYDATVGTVEIVDGDTKYINTSLVLSNG